MAAKTKEHVHNLWKTEWFAPIAVSGLEGETQVSGGPTVSGGLTNEEQVEIRTVIAKEAEWVIRIADHETSAEIRRDKIDTQIGVHEAAGMIAFDPYFQYRKSFFNWVLNC